METDGLLAGLDIGGTKCAVSLGRVAGDQIGILARERFPTPATPGQTLTTFISTLEAMLEAQQSPLAAIGVSCGGPLDSQRGVVLSPPNLPGWDEIRVVDVFYQYFNVPVALQNDANAGALAEWLWGATGTLKYW